MLIENPWIALFARAQQRRADTIENFDCGISKCSLDVSFLIITGVQKIKIHLVPHNKASHNHEWHSKLRADPFLLDNNCLETEATKQFEYQRSIHHHTIPSLVSS
jgi:hypothetical protein